ncbi:uncharacterized protein LOC132204352 [Neocloeon triangulifer]|uniref:uncharacterized protein LOC132204352 n=1 Tax=Neocloeon triangulifer TaxID=2078957 RepID=UPI00286ECB99|nr:uncharacterized protein LOC132204352 [Neocloeon triangulifer]
MPSRKKSALKNTKKQGRRFYIVKCCGHATCLPRSLKRTVSTVSRLSSFKNKTSTFSAEKTEEATNPTESSSESQIASENIVTDGPVTDSTTSELETSSANIPTESGPLTSDITTEFHASTSSIIVTSMATLPPTDIISGPSTSAESTTASTTNNSPESSSTTINTQLESSPTTTVGLTTSTSTATSTSSTSTSTATTTSTTSTKTSTSTSTKTSTSTPKPTSTSTSTTVTTTTTKPRNLQCEASRCANLTFNSTITTDAALQMRKQGKVIIKSGKTYLMMPNAETQAQAAKNCFTCNMSLIAIQNITKLPIFQQIMNNLNILNIWTVGSNEGNGSCVNYDLKFAWCPTNVDIPVAISDKVNGSNLAALAQKALALDGTLAYLLAIPSITKLPYLCELNNLQTDTCSALICGRNNSLFDANGNLKDGEKSGKWINVCNKNYLFSNKLGTWQQSWDTCCSLGMRPVWFQDASDMACLTNATKSNWTLNYNYWTAGRAQGSWGQWAFCAPGGPLTLPDSLSWAAGQPDNASPDELCLHMQVGKNGANLTLNDRNCSHKYVIACQSATNLASLCAMPSCPSNCSKNETLFTGDKLSNLFVHGQWNSGCGKEYLFSSKQLNWADAWTYCCSIGMKLTSIEAVNELQCLTNMVAKYPKAAYPDQTGRDFWTSGSNAGCPGPQFWCSENDKLIKDEIANWKDGKFPTEKAEMCIFLNLSNTTVNETYLGEESCTVEKPFVCETFQAGNKSIQIQRTCQEIWNVTDQEVVSIIMNAKADVTSQNRNLKCYIRCCGKKSNMIKSGGMVSDQILRGLEDQTASDPLAMQGAFGTFDSCSTLNNNDECVTTAKIFQCGKNNAPELTIGLVSLNKGDAAVASSATGGIVTAYRVCALFPSCTPDATQINQLKTTGALSSGGNILASSTGKKYLWKYIVGWTLAQAQAQCCAIGANLATFETLADFNAFTKIIPAMSGSWGFIGLTFDNGDGTDSWCSTFKKLPVGMITDIDLYYRTKAYPNQIYFTETGLVLSVPGVGANFVICGPLPY